MPGLQAVEAEPRFFGEPPGGTLSANSAGGMVGDEVRSAVALLESGGQGAADYEQSGAGGVAAENPDHRLVAPAMAEIFSINLGRCWIEQHASLIEVGLG